MTIPDRPTRFHRDSAAARASAAVTRLAAAALLSFAAVASASPVPPPALVSVPTPDPSTGEALAEDAALRDFERLGRELYRADRAAWLTTDLLAEQGILRRGKLRGVDGEPAGWITSPLTDGNTWRVAYIANQGDALVSFADGTVDFTAEPIASLRRNEPARPLDADEALQRTIAADAIARDWLVCGRAPYNRAIVPDGRGSWHVYLMPPQKAAKIYPMGGFHRFQYDSTGRFVAQYAHTRGCLEQSEDGLPPGATLDSLMITHITGPTPNDIHVFMSLAYGKPIFVATSDRRLWKVADGQIAFVSHLGGGQ